jgi:hypothetical protein
VGLPIDGGQHLHHGAKRCSTVNNITYWMGTDKFYMYSGRVETLPCALRQYVYEDINLAQSFQFFASTNEGYNEVWWFYCSAIQTRLTSTSSSTTLSGLGTTELLARTAWLDSSFERFSNGHGIRCRQFNGNQEHKSQGIDWFTTRVRQQLLERRKRQHLQFDRG